MAAKLQVWLLVLGVFLSLAVLPAVGSAKSGSSDRDRVSDVAVGKQVVVQLHKGLGKKVKGSFVASDASGITVRTKDQKRTTIPWDKVRKVKTKRSWHGLWIGMATGAALAGATLMADNGDSGATWAAAWVATGATSGVALGAPLDPCEAILYEAPKEEDPDQ